MNAVLNEFSLEAPSTSAARGRDLDAGGGNGLERWHQVRQAVLRFEQALSPGQITIGSLRTEVAELLDVPAEELGDDDDLTEWGLDSVRLMSLVNRWQMRGAAATFPELAAAPRLSAWVPLLMQPVAFTDRRALPAVEVGPFPLTPVQHAYWVGRGPGLPLGEVACHFYVEFEAPSLDRGVLETAIQVLLQRHPMLSARFHDDGTQSVPERPRVHSMVVNDWRGLDPEEGTRQRLLARDRLSHRRHDVAAGEVVGFELSLLPQGVVLHFDIDLLVADVLSIRLLLRDLAAAMQGTSRSPAANTSFAQYLAWRDQRDQALRRRDSAYWLARVDRLPAPPPLPLAQDPSRLREVRFERRSTWLDAASVQRLQQLAQQAGVTLPIALLTAYALVLARWSGCAHFILSMPVFDRLQPTADIAEMVADFTDLVILEVDLRARGTFAQSCRQQQRAFREAMAHRAFSGVEILRELGRRGLLPAGIPAVFTSAVGLGELIEPEVRRTLGTPAYTISQTPQVWLDHQVVEHEGGLLINWDGVKDLLAPGVAQAMFEAYERLLEGLMDAAQWEHSPELELPLEQRSVRAHANDTAAALPRGLLQDGFVAQAHSRPQAVALCWQEQGSCSYGELLRQVQAVAQLLQTQGVGAGDLVGLTLDKGPLQVAAVLGVLAVGAAYVPVGVEQPVQRRRRIYDDAKVRLVLTQREQRDALQAGVSQPVHALPEEGSDAPLPRLQPDAQALAYVIYTSGSTGEPKGVRISHAAALNTVQEVNRRWQVQAQDRVLGVSALDFDLSVYDIFGPLSVGAALVLPLEAQRRDAHAWRGLMQRWEVSVWNSVPALLEMLLSVQHEERSLSGLRLALLSGDWIALDLPQRLRAAAPGCRFVGLGGATEAAIWSNAIELEEAPPGWSSIPYGWPLANQSFRVVDALGQDCPDWVQGELWIGGAGVAQGYHEDPQRSASRFVLHEGRRWYRTGDLGRYRPDGCLEFLGRADQQVKVKGHRIELGEVEAALRRHVAVSDVAVLALGERQRTLVAAVAVGQVGGLTEQQLQEFAQQHLPGYAVPAQWLVLQRLPLTSNGKIDRRELQRLCVQQQQQALQSREQDAPQGELERELAALWCELLALPAVQRSDHFMSLGGDSLLATRMIEQLRQRGRAQATVAALFMHPVLKDFALVLGAAAASDHGAEALSLRHDPSARYEPFATTEVQRAYWLGRLGEFELGGVGAHYFMEFVAPFEVDTRRLEWALNELVQRHAVLRTIFPDADTQQVLSMVPHLAIGVSHVDPSGGEQLAALRDEMSHRVFDPAVWPLLQVHMVKSPDACRVMVGIDNLVMDAFSISLFMADWSALYAGAELPPAPRADFRDYVMALSGPEGAAGSVEAARAHWRERMQSLPAAPALPLDREPSQVRGHRFERRSTFVAPAVWNELKARARAHGITPTVLLAGAFAEVLRRWSGQPGVTLNLTVFDRPSSTPDAAQMYGDFTSLLLLPYTPTPGASWARVLQDLQVELGMSLQHRQAPATWVLRELGRQRGGPVRMPVVFTSTLGTPAPAPFDLSFGRYEQGISQTPQVWLDHQVVEHEGGLLINWDGVKDLLAPGVAQAMFEAYERLLEGLMDAAQWEHSPELELPLEQRSVRAHANDTAAALPRGLLQDGFVAQAHSRPQAVALCWQEQGSCSYGELLRQVQAVAQLLQTQGVGAGDLVGLTLDKGPLQVAAVLGVLAVGAAYVPVGVEQPVQRRRRIYDDAKVRLVLTQREQRDALQAGVSQPVHALPEEGSDAPLPRLQPDAQALAYVIYTSGSTGEPKGVRISHAAALNTVQEVNRRWQVQAQDRVLGVSALDFDLSVYDIFGPLSVGAALVLPLEAQRRDAHAWRGLMQRWEVSVWNSVPALLEMLLSVQHEERSLSGLRLALLSGDWIALDLPQRLRAAAPGCRFVGLGGATEAAIWSNAIELEEAPPGWSSIPYGWPLANQSFRVVDALGQDCPDWVQGELWIGGAGVAQGYHEDPQRSASRFVLHEGRRWYRTGDLGRYRPDGCLEFLGRADQQVKVKGHRIELGEVEAALRRHVAVSDVAVLALGERQRTLVAAVAVGQVGGLTEQQLQEFAQQHLPGYAVPAQWLVLQRLPLTSNGKIDRRELQRLCVQQQQQALQSREQDAPQGELERELAALWCELLALPAVQRSDHFMSLGGDSLLATRMIEQLRQRWHVSLGIDLFLRAPTVAALATQLQALRDPAVEEGCL